ncbi:MAG: O-antigen ligase family protein [Anaerolineae bacterium]
MSLAPSWATPRRLVPLALGGVLAAAVAVLPLKYAVVVAALPFAVAFAVHPEWLLFALPLLVPFTYYRPLSLGGFRIGLVDVAIVAMLVAWLALSVTRRRVSLRWGALGVALLLWLWVAALSLPGAFSLSAGLAEAVKWGEVLAVYLLVLALARRGNVRFLIYGIAAAGTVSALIGLFQFATGTGPAGFLLFGRFMRAYGTFEQPNPFAGHLGLSLPFALAWALAAPRPRAERLVLRGLAGVMALGIAASWSRGGWLALVAAGAVMVVMLSPRLAAAAVTVALVATLFAGDVSGSLLVQRLIGMGGEVTTLNVSRVEPTDENFSVVERLAHWQAGWYMFASRPWLGVGIGNYEAAYPQFRLPRWTEALGHAHNYYLNVIAEVGLLGLTAFAVLGARLWLVVARGWRRASAWARPLLLGAAGSLVYFSVHSLVDNLLVNGMQALIGLALGVVALALLPMRQSEGVTDD